MLSALPLGQNILKANLGKYKKKQRKREKRKEKERTKERQKKKDKKKKRKIPHTGNKLKDLKILRS